jgi:hypothetical protein
VFGNTAKVFDAESFAKAEHTMNQDDIHIGSITFLIRQFWPRQKEPQPVLPAVARGP